MPFSSKKEKGQQHYIPEDSFALTLEQHFPLEEGSINESTLLLDSQPFNMMHLILSLLNNSM